MIEIKVKVSGPGMCINHELEVIERALRAAGCSVTVVNPYPTDKPVDPTLKLKSHVTLTADHLPWGG